MTVAVVHVGLAALGEHRRVESWLAALDAAGLPATAVPLLGGRRVTLDPRLPVDVVRGRAVPEAAAWSRRAAAERLAALRPEAVVFVTGRAHRPGLADGARVVLDLVDPLSASYAQRRAIESRRGRRGLFRVLAGTAARFEATVVRAADAVTLAGRGDAEAAGATWLPNLLTTPPAAVVPAPTHDLVFVGTLSYPPNADALAVLDDLWPELQRRRPGVSLLAAGRSPTPEVRARCARRGWELVADFDDLDALLARGRLAVAPLRSATGFQNKVLEAAARGVPQVLSPAAAAGFDAALPAEVAALGEPFAAAVARLLDDGEERARLGAAGRAHALAAYAPAAWAATVSAVVGR